MSRGPEGDVEGGLGEGEGTEGSPLLPLAPAPVSSQVGLSVDPSASLRDAGAGPSRRADAATTEHGETNDRAASRDDSYIPRGRMTQELLATVNPGDTNEINRLRELVDTRLHRAVEAGDLAEISRLVDAGASLASLDLAGRTPLHLCIHERLLEPFQVLLSYAGSVDVKDASGLPLLHVALLHEWRNGVSATLDAGADVAAVSEKPRWCPDDFTRYPRVGPTHSKLFHLAHTPIHIAVATNETELLEEILAVAVRNGDVDCLNGQGQTALYTAIEMGNLLAVQTLVTSGASVNRISNKNQTALHIAVKHSNILKYLLDKTNVVSSFDDEGLAPIHCAVKFEKTESVELLLEKFKHPKLKTRAGKTPLHMAAKCTSTETAKVIFMSNLSTIDEKDGDGDNPLHTAAREGNRALILKLLHYGGDLSTKGKNEQTVLEIIATTFLDSLNFFEEIFDERISFHNDQVEVDYTILTKVKDVNQIDVIDEFLRYDYINILQHPFIKSLLYLKMKHFLLLFSAMLIVYGVFLSSFNIFVVYFYYHADSKNNTNMSSTNGSEARGPGEHEEYGGWQWFNIVCIYFLIFVLLVQEILCINFKKSSFSTHLKSSASICALLLYAIVPVAMSVAEPADWARHAACVALLSTWIQAMFLMARVPIWGNYIPMFWKVAADLLKVFAIVAFLLVLIFSFCFMIQYQSAAPFDGPVSSFVKTLVMMSSEFDYEGLFGEDHSELQDKKTIVRLLFVVFVIFGALALMNFMIGIAVSDINELRVIGNIRRLEKEVELLRSLECLVYDGLYGKLAKKFNSLNAGRLHKRMEILNARSVTAYIEKNCLTYGKKYDTESFFQFHRYAYFIEMYKDLLDIAKKEKGENKSKITDTEKIDVLYDTVVGRPVNSSNWLREVISKQNEQMKSMADNLLQVTHVNELLKRSNEDLSSKINQMTSDVAIIKKIIANKYLMVCRNAGDCHGVSVTNPAPGAKVQGRVFRQISV